MENQKVMKVIKQEYLNKLNELGSAIEFEKNLRANDYSGEEVREIFNMIEDEIPDHIEFNAVKNELECYKY